MNIFVLIKQVPVLSEIHMDHDSLTIDRSSAGKMTNPADLHAIEAALDLKARLGGTVIALTMGGETAEAALREAVGMGADRAVHISDESFCGADTFVTSHILASALRLLGPADCIFCGQASLDSATGQIGGKLASILKMSFLASAVRIDADAQGLTIHRKSGGGYEVWRGNFPLVCSVTEDAPAPRMVTLRGKMAAKKAEILQLSQKELNLPDEQLCSLSRVEALFPVSRQEAGTIVSGKDEKEAAGKLADILFERHLI